MQRSHHQADTDRQQAISALAEMLSGIRYAILVTRDEQGRFESRPLNAHDARFDGTLWFFISASGRLARQLRANRDVLLTYADPDRSRYVSLRGVASVLRDPPSARDLWSPHFQAFFPGGPEDADLALLSVAVQEAEYWETPGGLSGIIRIIQVFNGTTRTEVISEKHVFTGAMES